MHSPYVVLVHCNREQRAQPSTLTHAAAPIFDKYKQHWSKKAGHTKDVALGTSCAAGKPPYLSSSPDRWLALLRPTLFEKTMGGGGDRG